MNLAQSSFLAFLLSNFSLMTSAMNLTTLSGLPVPIIYGTAWKKERTAELVVAAVLAGFRGIDTACQPKHYQEVEENGHFTKNAHLGPSWSGAGHTAGKAWNKAE